MALFLQIVVFLIVAAALGFAVGWLVRGARFQGESARTAGDWQSRLGQLEAERDRLQADLAAARADQAALERAQVEGGQSARAGNAELEERATRLQRERDAAHHTGAEQRTRHQAEVGRLEARIAELQAGTLKADGAPGSAAPRLIDEATAGAAGAPPPLLPGPAGASDDLKRISGIGPGIEKTLHELGIHHFSQIADFTPENVAWINQRLRFKGRIEREDWIGQAKKLAVDS